LPIDDGKDLDEGRLVEGDDCSEGFADSDGLGVSDCDDDCSDGKSD
jgi:hypothetical protein